jgi:hypothetical protein
VIKELFARLVLVIQFVQLLLKKLKLSDISKNKTIIINPWVNTMQFGSSFLVQFL